MSEETEASKYRATLWRKALERRGWKNLRKGFPMNIVIEYHVLYRGYLYSGRCKPLGLNSSDVMTAGTTLFLLRRTDMILEGVWRRARNQGAETGRRARRFEP
ncbi:hypothetical protein ACQKFL_11455 [Vreelandella titanicae]|uniref:hypothetical protein n=1 Tax=Vreelandella titanicae TaxID=664683 RepID=UPI003D07B7A4